jgi:hypothetical protein
MLRSVDRAKPTFWQRVVILMATQVLTVALLILWTAGSPWTETSATSATAAPRVASVVTVGNGYAVRRLDRQPTEASAGGAEAAVLPFAPLPPAPSR